MMDARRLRVAFVTIGCKANVADTRMLAESLAAAGLEVVPSGAGGAAADPAADVFVLNTCTVTHRADADARAAVRKLRRAHPNARIVATGCLAEVTPEALAALPEVDAVIGNRGKGDVGALLAAVAPADRRHAPEVEPIAPDADPPAAAGSPPNAVGAAPAAPGADRLVADRLVAYRPVEAIRELPSDRTRPFVKVQDGCDHTCTYCIIPRARGRSRSLPPADVLATVRRYGELGAAEVVLTGIHVGMYGRDLPAGRPSLAGLLERLDDGSPSPRIRLSSLEPDELDERLLSVLSRPRFCPHLHLPLQSGDDGVLARMGRRYTTADYAATVARARAALPTAAIGADVIVGFPGESEAAFERTLGFVAALPLTYLHVFPFSPRAGTPAASYPDPVPPPVARGRAQRLRELGARMRRTFHERLVGTSAAVLIQDVRADGSRRGLTEHYVPVTLRACAAPAGSIVVATLRGRDGAGMTAS